MGFPCCVYCLPAPAVYGENDKYRNVSHYLLRGYEQRMYDWLDYHNIEPVSK